MSIFLPNTDSRCVRHSRWEVYKFFFRGKNNLQFLCEIFVVVIIMKKKNNFRVDIAMYT